MGEVATGLTTLKLVKEAMGITDGNNDSLIDTLIRQTTDEIEQEIQSRIIVAEYTDVLDGSSFTELVLKHKPVVDFKSLTLNAAAVDTDAFEVNDEAGILVRVTTGVPTAWTNGVRNYTAIYTAGYETIPAGLEGIATDIVGRRARAKSKGRLGIESEVLASGGATAFQSSEITEEEWKKLRSYGNRF